MFQSVGQVVYYHKRKQSCIFSLKYRAPHTHTSCIIHKYMNIVIVIIINGSSSSNASYIIILCWCCKGMTIMIMRPVTVNMIISIIFIINVKMQAPLLSVLLPLTDIDISQHRKKTRAKEFIYKKRGKWECKIESFLEFSLCPRLPSKPRPLSC